jgi:hypothetical protein
MSHAVHLTRTYADRRVLFLHCAHSSSFPARVIGAPHTVSRKMSRNRRQVALLVSSKVTVRGESRGAC